MRGQFFGVKLGHIYGEHATEFRFYHSLVGEWLLEKRWKWLFYLTYTKFCGLKLNSWDTYISHMITNLYKIPKMEYNIILLLFLIKLLFSMSFTVLVLTLRT